MKILGIIPARGGSKSIKNKNIIDVCGKPLIAYTCEPAVKALTQGLIDKLVLSTDSQAIVDTVQSYDVDVPFMRPDDISGDLAKSYDAFLHAIDFYEQQGKYFDAILILQPTSPLRRYEDIEKSLSIFREKQLTSLVSCYAEDSLHPQKMYYIVDGKTVPVDAGHNDGTRRQEYNKVYVRNGAIYIVTTDYIKANKRSYCPNPYIYEMPKEISVDIDQENDLTYAKKFLMRKK